MNGNFLEILKDHEAREQQVFSEMKEEMRHVQHRKAIKQRNFNNLMYGNIVKKRDTMDSHFIPSQNEESNPNVPEVTTTEISIQARTPHSSPNAKTTTSPTYSISTITTSTTLLDLPSKGQTFHDIRINNQLFIDKTQFIPKLLSHKQRLFFFTRPRGFGKTVFLEMLHKFLNGSKEYFHNTFIYEKGNLEIPNGEWKQFPVIYLNFILVDSVNTIKDFKNALYKQLTRNAVDNILQNKKYKSISQLIDDLNDHYHLPISILIDNYDNPFLQIPDSESDVKKINKISFILREFYKQIIASYSKLKLVLVMGHTNLDILNNGGQSVFTDLTYDTEFSQALGFTSEEVNQYLKPYIEKLQKNNKDTAEANKKCKTIEEEMNTHYGNFQFSPYTTNKVLNPSYICECLDTQKFDNYIRDETILFTIRDRMIEYDIDERYFKNFPIPRSNLQNSLTWKSKDLIPLPILMLCHGFLTIDNYIPNSDIVELTYPNKDTEDLIKLYLDDGTEKIRKDYSKAETYLQNNNMESFIDMLNDFAFRTLSKVLQRTKLDELYCTRILLAMLRAMKFKCEEGIPIRKNEGRTGGDIDIYIKTRDSEGLSYVIEVKYKKKGTDSILQLLKYALAGTIDFRQALNLDSKFHMVGINFREKGPAYENPEIMDWISIPYKNEKIFINKMKHSKSFSDLDALKNTLKEELKKEYNEEKLKSIIWSD